LLRGVFRTKEGKLIAFMLIAILMVVGGFVINISIHNRQYEQQTVMAKQYLEAGNYEQAIEAYQKAISMKGSDEEYLTIGLAEAYVGIHQYDKALEVLRNCYQKTSGNTIKEKIEEITTRKSDYEYQQVISRGDVYYSNEEYDKAISEYQNAKLIKSKEVTSYQKIAECYIKMEQYEPAKEEIEEGLAITQSEKLNQILEVVNSHLLKQQYDSIIAKAEELIIQENYNDGIVKYQEAIQLLPKESKGYIGMANAFIAQEKYQAAINLLEGTLNQVYNDELKATLEKAIQLQEAKEIRKETLYNLYFAAEEVDIAAISEIMNSDFFMNEIAKDTPIYYSPLGEGNISKGYGMLLVDDKSLYSGNLYGGIKNGKGIFIQLTDYNGEDGYYYYQGSWSEDVPNGKGKTLEVRTETDEDGRKYTLKIVTEGNFYNGRENNQMKKTVYIDEEYSGSLSYYARMGVPLAAKDENGMPLPTVDQRYPIGVIMFKDVSTDNYYYVEPDTLWGVKPIIKGGTDFYPW